MDLWSPKTSTLVKGLHLVQEKLNIDSDNQHSGPAKGKAVCAITSEDEDVTEEEIGDNFNEEKFNLYQDSIYRGLKNAHVQELAVNLSTKQMRVLRGQNKRLF